MGFCHAPFITASRATSYPTVPQSGFVTGPQLAMACPSSMYQPLGDVLRDVGALSLLETSRTHRRVGLPHRFPRWG